jgi:hypothetical protein
MTSGVPAEMPGGHVSVLAASEAPPVESVPADTPSPGSACLSWWFPFKQGGGRGLLLPPIVPGPFPEHLELWGKSGTWVLRCRQN